MADATPKQGKFQQLTVLQNLKPGKLLSYLCLFSCSWLSSPAIAAGEVLGVVKSEENVGQWSEITNRLERVGIDYCVVDSSQWQQEIDFGGISVLLLPSVGIIEGSQAIALEEWMNKGGKVVVTGPTGNFSSSLVRDKLRSLFGAYWAYPLSNPTTLQLSDETPAEWYGRSSLEQTFMGAVVLPTEDSIGQTAANWVAESSPPAAVITDNATVLGWRWGVNAVTEPDLDTAWLQAALNRYGISTYGRFNPARQTEARACRPEIVPQEDSRPFIPGWELENSPDSRYDSLPTRGFALEEKENMIRELEGLIDRFETTLLTADAKASEISSSTSELVEQLVSQSSQGNKSNQKNLNSSSYPQAHQALKKAKTQFRQFLELSEQSRYSQAKRQWLEARNTLWKDYPTDRKLATSEIRAIWLDRGTIVKTRSEKDLAKLFDRMEKAGINTVFFETVNSGYTVYPSRIAPQQNPLIRNWDPLKAAVKLAHERDMELHAWVWTFATVNQRHNTILNLPKEDLGPILSRYPDWAITDKKAIAFTTLLVRHFSILQILVLEDISLFCLKKLQLATM